MVPLQVALLNRLDFIRHAPRWLVKAAWVTSFCLFVFVCLLSPPPHSVYSGHQSILIPPLELESSLPLWLSTLSQYKIRDTFCSYSVMELCTKGLGTQTEILKVRLGPRAPHFRCIRILSLPACSVPIATALRAALFGPYAVLASAVSSADTSSFKPQARGLNLSCVRSCVVIAEERPRLSLTQSFSKLFKDLGLSPRAVSTAFGSRVNLAICLQVTFTQTFRRLFTLCSNPVQTVHLSFLSSPPGHCRTRSFHRLR